MVPKNILQDQNNIKKKRFLDFLELIENNHLFLEYVITADSLLCLNMTQKPSVKTWNGTLQLLQDPKKQE